MDRVLSYGFFFLIGTAGIILILWDGIPIFRKLVQFQRVSTVNDEIIWLTAIALIQFAYWKCLRHDPPFDIPRRPFLAHIILFVSRLIFIFVSGVFSFVVYRYSDRFDLTFARSSLVIAIMFSVFCFSRYLEKIGGLMQTGYRSA
jgi:hypothetical protein